MTVAMSVRVSRGLGGNCLLGLLSVRLQLVDFEANIRLATIVNALMVEAGSDLSFNLLNQLLTLLNGVEVHGLFRYSRLGFIVFLLLLNLEKLPVLLILGHGGVLSIQYEEDVFELCDFIVDLVYVNRQVNRRGR